MTATARPARPTRPAFLCEECLFSAQRLAVDLRRAHSQACDTNPILAVLLRDLTESAANIQHRMGEIVALQTRGF